MGAEQTKCGWGLEQEYVVDPRDWGDGCPIRAKAGVRVLVGERSSRVLPAGAVGPPVKGWVSAPFV